MHRPVFMTGSWRKSQETKSPPWRKETYGLPAWQMLVLVISPLCTLFMWWVTTRHPLFSHSHAPPAPTQMHFHVDECLVALQTLAGRSEPKWAPQLGGFFFCTRSAHTWTKYRTFCFQEKFCSSLSAFFFLLHSLPNWPNLDQWWLNEHHYACVHESVESADLRLSVLADAKGRSLEASKRKLPC